jgi:hypothetical protein
LTHITKGPDLLCSSLRDQTSPSVALILSETCFLSNNTHIHIDTYRYI